MVIIQKQGVDTQYLLLRVVVVVKYQNIMLSLVYYVEKFKLWQ